MFFCLCSPILLAQVDSNSTSSSARNTEVVNDSVVDLKYREDQFYLGITYNLLSNVPSSLNIRGLSGGIHFGYLRDMPINERRNIAIAIGAGAAFDVYGNTLFVGEKPNEETIFTILNDVDVRPIVTAEIIQNGASEDDQSYKT